MTIDSACNFRIMLKKKTCHIEVYSALINKGFNIRYSTIENTIDACTTRLNDFKFDLPTMLS